VIISSETDENSGNPNAGTYDSSFTKIICIYSIVTPTPFQIRYKISSGLGPSWGAVAVADHNSRPWEDPEQDFSQDSLANTPVSDLFEDQSSITNNNNKPNQSSNNGPNRPNHPLPLDPSIPVIGAAEMHEFPHQNHPYQYPAEQNVVSQTSSVSSTSSPASTRYPFINP